VGDQFGRDHTAVPGPPHPDVVIVDPSGNLWATNNWKEVPLQTNPGGLHVIAFVGAAAPVPLS
jgi:hypothetical protein